MKALLFLLVTSILVAVPASSQQNPTLSGTLTDPSGAAIAGAEISAHPIGGGAGSSAKSLPDGSYSLTLSPGRYRVRVVHPSFAHVEREFTIVAGEPPTWSPRLPLEPLAATVVVSAQAEPSQAAAVTSQVTVLTRETIEQRQTLWLGPLLARTPGFALSQLGREGGVTTMFLNGGNSNFTKVLADGATLNEPGGAVDFSNLALENVEKVEVIRGAESALYGSDAMAGVIQIFTRRGSTHRPLLNIAAEGGRFGTLRVGANLSGLISRFDYSVAAGHFNTDGQGPNDFFRNTTLSGNFGWQFSETSRLRLALRSNTSDVGVQGQISLIPPDTDQHNALRNFSSALTWELQTGARWRHRVTASDTYIRQIFDDPSSDFCLSTPPFPCDFAFTARNRYNRAGLGGQSTYAFPRGGVTLGYQYEVENGFFSGTHGRRNNHAGYLEARYLVGNRLSLIGGARAEANDNFGTRVVPRFGAAYALRLGTKPAAFWGATRVRGSIGAGIKEPSLAQSLAQDACFPGNAALRPERSRAFSVGADQVLAGDRVRVGVDFFHNRFRDIVSFAFGQIPGAPPSPALCPFGFGSFFNTDLARARGTNVAAESRVTTWLRVGGHYSYVDGRVLESPNAFDPALQAGNRLLRRPVNSGALELNANAWRMNWNLLTTLVGPRTDSDFLGFGLTRNPGYGRVDLAGSYEVHRGVTAFGRVENLFDKKYEETLGFPAYRRSYRLGMRFTLGGE